MSKITQNSLLKQRYYSVTHSRMLQTHLGMTQEPNIYIVLKHFVHFSVNIEEFKTPEIHQIVLCFYQI